MKQPAYFILVVLLVLAASCRPRNTASTGGGHTVDSGAAASQPRELAMSRYGSQQEADSTSAGCLSCHMQTDAPSMHPPESSVFISCVDCHAGDASISKPDSSSNRRPFDQAYLAAMNRAHVQPRVPQAWSNASTGQYSSANPVRSYTLLNHEDPRFIQFVNPGDLRIADRTCGACHADIVRRVRTSMMTHGAQLWAAALYNNGSYPHKTARFGESYSASGIPQHIYTVPPPSTAERTRGVLDSLDPLPRWEVTQMGNLLRAFERGGKVQRAELEPGLPNPLEEPGRPDMKLSDRGLGTQLATDPVFLGLQKTRLLDPILSFMGTNDHPGDFRSSGCSACHVIYANDRSQSHSERYAAAGHRGYTQTVDPTIPRDEAGHPIRHEMTRSIPSSQCIVCHIHPGTSFANSYFGYTWWDNETHGEYMYPAEQRPLTAKQITSALLANPEAASLRGLWSNLRPNDYDHLGNPAGERFLERSSELNSHLDQVQFADFHGHGWMFRAVFKQDRQGRLLDHTGGFVQPVTSDALLQAVAFRSTDRTVTPPANIPVHLKDIHLERGMHCVDCHFEQDVHGDGRLYGEVRNAIEIDCIDCHGTIRERATLQSSGPAGDNDLSKLQTPFGRRFDWRGGRLYQRSTLEKDLIWAVPQIADSVDPGSGQYNKKAAYAKTLRRDGRRFGDPGCPDSDLAHGNSNMTCYACHTSWMTSCFGCHLSMRANFKMPMLHNEGDLLRNFTTYNYQVLRDDVFMLGRDSIVKGGKVVPVRSSSAVVVGSQNANREWVYSQQQTVSTEGFAGQAFNPHFPHAVRKTETKQCTDCHLSQAEDNNAWMAQVLLQGTNFVNFLGRYVYVAEGDDGFEAVVVTERDEPQAVIGSYLHSLAYPAEYAKHLSRGSRLAEAYEHGMTAAGLPRYGGILDVQLRGEYLYAARGEGGFYAYDVANIDNKGFSERIVTAPVSPLGQSLHVKTNYATSVASPTTMAVDPTRSRMLANEEQPIHPIYAYLYVSDLKEGLVVIGDPRNGVGTLLDGNPTNNFLRRAATFNPDGMLDGAVYVTIAGHYAYVCCTRGLVIVDLEHPRAPRIAAVVGPPSIQSPTAVAVQFRYAFVCDGEGMKVVDITSPENPIAVGEAAVDIRDAKRLYVARTHAYVAAGRNGLAIVDIERPRAPRVTQVFTADGRIDDARDVKVGMTNASLFAYIADGMNGLRVVQLTSPRDTPGYQGFSPRVTPKLIATYPTHGPALAISKGLDRDRAVDESGHQAAVFGRLGARPLNLEEQRRLYVRDGALYRVQDGPE
jgi:hypothetical protein